MSFFKYSIIVLFFGFSFARAVLLEDILSRSILKKVFAGKKIGFFLGSFDPLHLSHEKVAQEVIKRQLCDYVLVYPTWGGDSYKPNKTEIVSRLNILVEAFCDNPKIIVTRLNPKKLQEVLTVLSHDNKGYVQPGFSGEFIGIMGSDVAIGLKYSADEEIDLLRREHLKIYLRGILVPLEYENHSHGSIMALPIDKFIVFLRDNDHFEFFVGQDNMRIEDREIIEVIFMPEEVMSRSSSLVRLIASHSSLDSLDNVSPTTARIIERSGLYGFL
jgi:phosphopantetheine adenylyltransferase